MLASATDLTATDQSPRGRHQEYHAIRAHFVARGTSLRSWCIASSVDYSAARKSLDGRWNGPKGRALKLRITSAATGDAA